MPDFNLAKISVPIKIKRAFEKGKIPTSYQEMYFLADKLASMDAFNRQSQEMGEYFDSEFSNNEEDFRISLMKTQSKVFDYKARRLEHHMKNMIHMLELYISSRETK